MLTPLCNIVLLCLFSCELVLLSNLVNILLFVDGCSCIVINGDVVAQGSQFSLKDIEVVVAQVDLDAV